MEDHILCYLGYEKCTSKIANIQGIDVRNESSINGQDILNKRINVRQSRGLLRVEITEGTTVTLKDGEKIIYKRGIWLKE